MNDVTYTIKIKIDDGKSDSPRTTARTTSGAELSPKETGDPSATKGEKYIQNTVRKVASLQFAAQAADMMVTYQINTISARTGNSRLQEQCNFAYSTAKSLVGSTVIGAVAGGPIGAVFGFFTSLIAKGTESYIAQKQINIERSVENVGLNLSRIRAGSSGNRTGKDA